MRKVQFWQLKPLTLPSVVTENLRGDIWSGFAEGITIYHKDKGQCDRQKFCGGKILTWEKKEIEVQKALTRLITSKSGVAEVKDGCIWGRSRRLGWKDNLGEGPWMSYYGYWNFFS